MVNKISGFKGSYSNEQLQKYLQGEFKDSVLSWNSRCGKGIPKEVSCIQIMQMIINQSSRLLEEMLEGLTAYLDKDTTGRMDALIDIQFVKVMLDHYYEVLDKFTDEDITTASLSFTDDELLTLQVVPQLVSPAIIASQGIDMFSPKRVFIACELIIANNDQKYTSDQDKMLTWKANLVEGTQIKTTEVGGVEYYSIVRLEDGKVMKPFDFEEVTLDLG